MPHTLTLEEAVTLFRYKNHHFGYTPVKLYQTTLQHYFDVNHEVLPLTLEKAVTLFSYTNHNFGYIPVKLYQTTLEHYFDVNQEVLPHTLTLEKAVTLFSYTTSSFEYTQSCKAGTNSVTMLFLCKTKKSY